MKRIAWFDRLLGRDTDLDQEIAAHLEEKTDALIATGMPRKDAKAAARRAFGNVSKITDRSRDVWRLPWLEVLETDVRYAFRMIKRYPAFSTNVIVISAIGIAACAATFSLVNGVLLTPLPFDKPENVFELESQSTEGRTTAATPVDTYLQIASDSSVVSSISAAAPSSATVYWGNEPERVRIIVATASFFQVFGIAPLRGRQFTRDEADHDAPVALLGNALWRTQYRGDSSVIGTTIKLDSVTSTIIGIMPPRFRAHFNSEPDVWLPMRVTRTSVSDGRSSVNAHLRVRDGVSADRASAWIASVARQRMESTASRDSVDAHPLLIPIHELVYGEAEKPLRILLASVLLVLLLVAANVATMFVARSSSRDQELGVRRALGASMTRQVVQLTSESVVLVSIGGAIGVFASYWIVATIRALGERILPRIDAVEFDWRVGLFALVATIFTGSIGGLLPALTARRGTVSRASGSRVTAHRTSSVLVTAQISLSVLLLVGAGLLVKGFLRVLPSSPGFAVENRTMLMVSLGGLALDRDTTGARSRQFIADVSERMKRTSGVRDVAAMSFVPFFGSVSVADVELTGYPVPPKPFRAYQNIVTPNLTDVLEISILRGRKFNERDDMSSERVAIVNQTAASRWWPGENPIGKRITVGRGRERVGATVIGEMSDARMTGTDTKIRAEMYVPAAQNQTGFVSFIVHTNENVGSLIPELKRAVWRIAPDLPVGSAGQLETYVSDSVRSPRFFAWVMGAFAAVAVALSGIAVYGLLTLDVVQRRREIGVRMALGATGSRISAMVLRRAAWLAGVGVCAGAVAARALSHYMESLLVEVEATDATVFAGTIALALAIATLAACAPAYRAVRVDPATSLRGD